MPGPDLRGDIDLLNHSAMQVSLAQLEASGDGSELHRTRTLWSIFAYSLHINNLNGALLQAEHLSTQNAILIFAELAARWFDPTNALQAMQSSSRKVPNWAKDAFSFYTEYYNAKLNGIENPDIAITTNDPIAQQAIDKFLKRENEFSFSEARQQQAQQNTQPAQTAAATLSPLTTSYPSPSLSGLAANCQRRRQGRKSHTESTTGTRRFLSSST